MASSSPTLSSSPLASATSSGTNSGGGGGSIFSRASATPLIVAFLAIGLLTTVAIGALGWRRAYLVRHGLQGLPLGHPLSTAADASEFVRRRREVEKRVDVLQKPKLWDMRTVGGLGGGGGVGGRVEGKVGEVGVDGDNGSSWSEKYPVEETGKKVSWQEIMPIAVYPPECCGRERGSGRLNADEVEDEDEGYAREENPARTFRYGRHLVETMKRILQGRLTAEAGITERSATREVDRTRREETRPKRIIKTEDEHYENLQVAVAIAMPKLRRSAPESEIIEYSVGICRIPCHEMEAPSNTHDPVTRY